MKMMLLLVSTGLLFGQQSRMFNPPKILTAAPLNLGAGSVLLNERASHISEDQPQYLQVLLDHPFVLAETLVGLENEPEQPISLALFAGKHVASIIAPPDCIQIVRWRAGENQFWIKISKPFNQMVQSSAELWQSQAYFSVGISGSLAQSVLQPKFLDGKANQPVNGRFQSPEWIPLDTSIRVTFPAGTLEEDTMYQCSVFSYSGSIGVRTAGHTDAILVGKTSPNFFGGVFPVAYVP